METKLQKYSLEVVIETLKKCSGIHICMVYPSLREADSDYDRAVGEFSCEGAIYNLRSYDLELVNGSRLWFFTESQAANQLRGRRAHQVFVKDVSEKFIEENCRPLISSRLSKGPLYRTGVFELYDERDEVNKVARSLIIELQKCSSKVELQSLIKRSSETVEKL